MYISFNNFANNNGALSLVHSDDGNNWTNPPVVIHSSFIRDVQLTGSPVGAPRYEGSNSTVFVAAMDEGGGGLNTRQNVIYKSLDGGATWTSTTTGARFKPPGSVSCGYFEAVAPIWRHMGWGQPGVGPSGVVHYAYAGAGTNGDVGDIFYVRSTDNGRTWSAPIKLNTDTDNSFHTQWMPSLSADKSGNVTVSWYDRRAATSACSVATNPGCSYERVGRQSPDNGVSFDSEITISSALIPQPTQTDPGVQACYAGDYDYDTTQSANFYDTWTDGRRAVSGVQVQDVEFAKAGPPPPPQLSCTPSTSCSIQGQPPGQVVAGQIVLSCNQATMLTASATICGNTGGCLTDSVAPPQPVSSIGAGDASRGNAGTCSLSWSWGGNNYSQNLSAP
jgi:hypothetical protein